MSERNTTHYTQRARECGIPEHCLHQLVAYIVNGTPVGHFLESVIRDQFANSFVTADETNKAALNAYARFMFWECPGIARGSREAYLNWIEHQGLTDEPRNP